MATEWGDVPTTTLTRWLAQLERGALYAGADTMPLITEIKAELARREPEAAA